MKRVEVLALAVVGFLMLAAGLTWLYGPYGLGGSGVGLALLMSFVNIKADKED
jgi:hypothetical protein